MQSVLPWAKKTLLHLRGSSPRPDFAQYPYSTARLEATVLKQVPWPPSVAYAAGQDYAAYGILSEHFSEAFPCVTAQQAQATPSDGRYTALDLLRVPKIPTRASAAAAPPVKLPASAAIVKAESRFPYRKSCVLNVTCNTAGSRWSP